MAFTFDHLDTSGKKALVIALTTLGIILSHLTTALRVYAKKISIGHLQKEDWFMCAALLATYPNMVMEFWGECLDSSKLRKLSSWRYVLIVSRHKCGRWNPSGESYKV
jgi:hypothetical protein